MANTLERLVNPFEITKATDFDDGEIASTWVDLPSGGGFRSLVDPTSPVTRFILGGKGSGRTHLLRYYSSRLQAMRLRTRGSAGLFEDGYVGIYVNTSALNPGRFSGKGQNDDTWSEVFAYYMDAALTLRTLVAVDEVWRGCGETDSVSRTVAAEVRGLFDVPVEWTDNVVSDLRRVLRQLDAAVNRAALTRELDVALGTSGGRLVFGTVEALADALGERGRLQFAVLLDEFENFSAPQQRCVQTLIREKHARLSFLVGARTAGIRTAETVSGERNREGSEFETLELDTLFRDRRGDYARFCRALIVQRLARSGLAVSEGERGQATALRKCFVESNEEDAAFVGGRAVEDRKCLVRLGEQLRAYAPRGVTGAGVDDVLGLLHCPGDPVLEKVSVLLFYRRWHAKVDLVIAAREIVEQRAAFLRGDRDTTFGLTVGHFRGDMVAQLLAEYKQRQRYLGLEECIALSGGLPRGLLVVLKHVFRWAVFNGERPFGRGAGISEESQRAGVLEAGRWFFTDQPGIGRYGVEAQEAMERLGRFLRALRFADKPTESSACTVSVDRGGVSDRARATMKHCVEASFLLRVTGGHRDRNTRVRKWKLQVHPMLCPRWDLPTGRRGVVELTADEANVIFDSTAKGGLRSSVEVRLGRMNPPFEGRGDVAGPGLEFDG